MQVLPGNIEGLYYKVELRLTDDGDVIAKAVPLRGFVIDRAVANRLTYASLQEAIKNGEPDVRRFSDIAFDTAAILNKHVANMHASGKLSCFTMTAEQDMGYYGDCVGILTTDGFISQSQYTVLRNDRVSVGVSVH